MTSIARFAFCVLSIGATVAGCGRDLPLTSSSADEGLRIVPADLELFRGQVFAVDVLLEGGEVTESVLGREGLELEVVPAELATIGVDGAGQALASGSGELVARFADRQARTNLVVRDAALLSITVDPPTLALERGARSRLRVTGQLSDGSAIDLTAGSSGTTYASSNEEIAAVSDDGQVFALRPGGAEISIQQGGQSVRVPVTVLEDGLDVVELRIAPSPIALGPGEEASFQVLGVRSDGSEISVLGDPELSLRLEGMAAILIAPGQIGGVSEGEAILVARLGGLEASADVFVSEDAAFIRLEVVPAGVTLGVGESQPLQVFGVRSNGEIVDITAAPETNYRSTDAAIGVSPTGEVTGLAPTIRPGQIVVTNGGLEARVEVTIRDEMRFLRSLEVEPSRLDFGPGEPAARLRVTGLYSDGTTEPVTDRASYTSENPRVALVAPGGVVSPQGPGSTQIVVQLEGIRATVPVTVGATTTLIGLDLFPPFIRVETDATFVGIRVVARFSDGSSRDVTFDPGTTIETLDGSVARWTGMAVVGVQAGATLLRATFGGLSSISPVLVTDAPPPPLSRIELIAPASLGVMESAGYEVTGILADGTRIDLTNAPGLAVTSSNPAVAEIVSGRVVGVRPGRVTLTATLLGFSDTATLEVRGPNETLTGIAWQPSSLTVRVGQAAEARLIATFSTGRTADISADPSVSLAVTGPIGAVQIGGAVQVAGLSAGSAAVVATFRGQSARLTVTVPNSAPRVTQVRVQVTSPLDVGDVGTFSVVAVFSDGTNRDVTRDPGLSLSVAPPGIIALSGGNLRGLSVGQATLTAVFSGVTGTATVRVAAATDPFVRVEFQPSSLTVQVNQSQSVRIFAVRQSGTRIDVTTDPNLRAVVTGPISIQVGPTGALDVRGTSAGSGRVTATLGMLSATLNVTVQGSSPQVTFIFITVPSFQIEIGQSVSYTVTARFADGTTRDVTNDPGLSISSSDATIFRLESGATIRGIAVGQANLQASFGGRTSSRFIRVIPVAVISGLLWSPGQLVLGVNQTRDTRVLAARVGASFLDVTTSTETSYTTTGPVTVAVNSTTNRLDVTATGNGQGTVVATYRGFSATLLVAAGNTPRVIGITTSPASPISLDVGDTVQINVTERLSDGTTRTAIAPSFQESSLPNQGAPITVSSTGLVTGQSIGQGRVIVRSAGFATLVTINVAAPPPTITTLAPNALDVNAGPTTLAITGANFASGDRVFVNGSPVPTTFVSGNRLSFTNAGPLFRTAGTVSVQVRGANGISNSVDLRLGVAPNVRAHSPTQILLSSTLEVSLVGVGLSGASYSGAPLTFAAASANPAGTRGTVEATVPPMTRPGIASVTVTNDFGSDTFNLEIVQPSLSFTPPPGAQVSLSGTNAFTSVRLSGNTRLTATGTEPVVILSTGDVTIDTNARIVIEGEDGEDGNLTSGDGGAAGPGGGGGGGGADGNGTPASGGAGLPSGDSAATSAGSGTAAGNGGGETGGGGAAGGCAQGGGGGGRSGRGGGGGGDSGIGTGGAGGSAGPGSDFGGGTGGGGGSTCSATNGGGGGGGGGGKLIIQVARGRTIRLNGLILADGGDGGDGTQNGSAGGGGGSGGLIELRAPGGSVIVVGRAEVRGGNGGNASLGDGGGGGSGGVILLEGTTINAPNARFRLSGGTGGGSARENAGQNGQAGQILRNP